MNNVIKCVLVCVIVLTFPSLALAAKTHRVAKGETLFSIAKKYRVTVDDLKSANNLVSNHLDSGDTIVIPPRPAAAGDGQGEKGKARGVTYRVKKGDNLRRIARKTGIPVAELKRLNGLSGTRVRPGTILALRSLDGGEEPREKGVKRYPVRNMALFSEKEYEQSLAELSEFDPDQPVDLSKNIELKVDNSRLLKKTAYSFLGTRYRFGGSSRSGLDCSSFVQQVFRELDVDLPRTAREQFWIGSRVTPGDLQKGDMVFFRTYASYPSHVGIYLGDNKMIHASSRDRRVVVSSMNTPYYRSRFIGAKRIAKINPDIFKLDELFAGVEEEAADEVLNNDTLGLNLKN